MTRKRFVKLLMAAGYSRNAANGLAKETQSERLSYLEAFVVSMIPPLAETIPEASRIMEAWSAVAEKMAEGMRLLAERLLEIISKISLSL